ncbi:GMC family oxidoreductase [Kiloniella majae]|uniref:GMC family oxidoreductase n=1 Tax=Kiloniella majae TaxID=1938558 RepID=UPI000A277A5B|nr:choline dehydrogenase [Kiloniella majae]
MRLEQQTFTYIIVGAGSAGCVVANRLSKNPNNTVLLIEAGGKDTYPWIHIPVGYFKTMHNPKTDWCFQTEKDPGLNNRSIKWPRGKVLGGSSSLNGLLYIRGQAADYDHWRQLGNDGWSYESVLPYFKKAEDQERGQDEFHGSGGPLKVSNIRTHRAICDAYIDAAEEIGIPRNDDFNGHEQEGAGYFQLTSHNGRRCSSAVAYLNPIKHRKNLTIVTKALVHKVILKNGRATGVELSFGKNSTQVIHSNNEIVLSAGAIGSPHILQLSGIGDPQHLQSVNIPAKHNLPGVGQNLRDHLQVRAVYKTKQKNTLNDEVNNPIKKMMMGIEYALFRTGPLTMGASQVGIFARTHPSLEVPDVQFHFQPLSSDNPGEGLHNFSAFTSSVCQLRPESQGQVLAASTNPQDYPKIHPNYLQSEIDQQVTLAGMKLSRQLAHSKALSPHIAEEYDPGPHVQTDEELLEHARNTANTIYHPVGTCKMGTDPMAVVDDRLRVRGIKGLRVADASIMPTLVSGNTNAPAIMIGEKAADMILDDA